MGKAKFNPDNITFGGNFGLTFGTTSMIDLSPWVGYKVHPKIIPGIGLSYVYFRQKFPNQPVYQTSMLGGRTFLRVDAFGPIFLYGEIEALNYDYYDRFQFNKERIWYVSQLIGGGYKQELGGGSAYMISILYSLNSENFRSPYYGNPLVFRFGFIIR